MSTKKTAIETAAGVSQNLAGAAQTVTDYVLKQRALEQAAAINAKNIQYQEDANRENWKNTLTAWNMENAYNTPSAQMQRYQDAGLNPNLIYQRENTAGAINTPQFVAPQLSMDPANIIKEKIDYGMLFNAQQNLVSNYQASDLRREEVQRLKLMNQQQSIINKYQDQKEYLAASRVKQEMRNVELDISQKEFEQSLEQRTNLVMSQKLTLAQKIQEIENSNVSNAVKRQQIKNLQQSFQQSAQLQGYRVASAYYDLMKDKFENDQRETYVRQMNDINLREAYLQLASDEWLSRLLGDPSRPGEVVGKGELIGKTFLVILQNLLKK